ncbi:ArsR family transcriptional regulator [Tenacibaculum sp. Bg11-29]|uniref:ArsR/SmtB family transcription factor n=1 Tax=Tenacibaculum sp. Bg11-29 TaxID=2058306 RepID=UPI000C34ACA6|nr:ArsR family transcriptional regulator [Tenacibaculum sp. Bg11-29]PKH52369.1 ArsR family transcriptional regulator [Tenacibaculum sp. Bg11-29]
MNKQEFKNSIYQEIANIGKALANPYRLRILNLISQDDYSVEQIANEIGVSIANASQHLQVLKKVKLLKIKKKGHYVIYSLTNSNVYTLWNALQSFSLQNTLEIQATLRNLKQEKFAKVTTINAAEIIANNNLNDLYFLDVRPEKEFAKEAIANAKSIPISLLKENLSQLPKNQQIVVYCRGALCFFADEAVQYLQENGYNAIRLKEEVLEWKQKGLPVN